MLSFQVDQLPMSETVMGIWSCLVRLAGNSSSAIPSVDEGSLFQPPSSKRTGNAALLPVPEQVATSGKDDNFRLLATLLSLVLTFLCFHSIPHTFPHHTSFLASHVIVISLPSSPHFLHNFFPHITSLLTSLPSSHHFLPRLTFPSPHNFLFPLPPNPPLPPSSHICLPTTHTYPLRPHHLHPTPPPGTNTVRLAEGCSCLVQPAGEPGADHGSPNDCRGRSVQPLPTAAQCCY